MFARFTRKLVSFHSTAPSSSRIAYTPLPLLSQSSSNYSSAMMNGKESLDVDEIQAKMKAVHASGVNLSYEWRRKQIQILLRMLQENSDAIRDAIVKDLGREETEAISVETKPLEVEIKFFLSNLKKWMQPKAVPSPAAVMPGRSHVEQRPLNAPGVLIIGPFNYPIRLVVQPLLGALSGGNPVVIKPSECTPHCAQLLKKLVEEYYTEPGVVQVVTGGVPETTALLERQWGMIFFTGSATVGKIVAKAAAETLTPTILELGGKSPVVVDETVPASLLQTVANRVVWGKALNAGQTCIAPDTLFVHESHMNRLCDAIQTEVQLQFGPNETTELGKMVNIRSAERVLSLIVDAEKSGGLSITGGSSKCDIDSKLIPPTFIREPSKEAKIMHEEIFGPAIPIVSFTSRDEAIQLVQKLPGEPLHLYIFTPNTSVFREFSEKCIAAGAFQNDLVLQGAGHFLPFGGIGSSGYGRYFGKYSFEAFTHSYPVSYRPLRVPRFIDSLRCHPYAGFKGRMLGKYAWYLPAVPVLHTRTVLIVSGVVTLLLAVSEARLFMKGVVIQVLEFLISALQG